MEDFYGYEGEVRKLFVPSKVTFPGVKRLEAFQVDYLISFLRDWKGFLTDDLTGADSWLARRLTFQIAVRLGVKPQFGDLA